MRTVGTIDPLGITRACTSVPSMNRNARITQNQERISRQILSETVSRFAGVTFSLSTATASSTSALTMSLHFELHQLSRIAAGVARRAKFSFRILERRPQRVERKIAQRISAKELADFFDGFLRGDQFFAARSIHSIVTGRNRRRATDADVHFGGAGLANQADDLAAGGAADDGIVDQNHALAFEHSTNRI